MAALKKPIATLIGMLAALVAGLFFTMATAGAYPAGVDPTLTVSSTTPNCGDPVTFSGSNYRPGQSVTVSVGADSTTVTADPNGDISGSLTVTCPNGVAPTTITGNGVDAVTIHPGGAGNGSARTSGSDSSVLSNTGVAVIGIGAVGVILLVGGGLLLMAGKRRKVSI